MQVKAIEDANMGGGVPSVENESRGGACISGKSYRRDSGRL